MENTTLVRPSDAEIADLTILQLTEQVQKRLAALEWFTDRSFPDARAAAAEVAREVVPLLLGMDRLRSRWGHNVAENRAHAVCNMLFGEVDPPPEFWATPLGAGIAWTIGYPLEQVPQWAAAAVLGFSRVSVFKAVRRGDLELTPRSLRAYLRNMGKWYRWSRTLVPDASTMQLPRHIGPSLAGRVDG
jgi:hypothetical protein